MRDQIANFRVGAVLKIAFSSIAGYCASALILDVGGLFIHPPPQLTLGLPIKNVGIVLSDYDQSSQLSVAVRFGATFKPEHMPLRFSLTAYNLTNSFGSYVPAGRSEPSTVNKILRSVNFGTEILLHRNVNLMIGYNYFVHQELKLENVGRIAGISFGFSTRIGSFEFVFSRIAYVIGNDGYAFTLSKNIETLLSRR